MSQCERIEVTLSALVDREIGEIEPSELLPTLDHLADCSSCQSFYRQSRGLEGVLAVLRDPLEMPTLLSGGWQEIAKASDLEPRWRQLRTKALAAAAAVVFAVGLWTAHFAFQPGPTLSDGSSSASVSVLNQSAGPHGNAMTDHRFVELTTELLRSDRRYQTKMQEVLDEVSSRSFIAEGSNEMSFPEAAENELELPESERDEAFLAFGPLWW